MKLEPLKKTHLPRYAAVLAVAASAFLMTGCRESEPALMGKVAVVSEPDSSVLQIDGETWVAPSPEDGTPEAAAQKSQDVLRQAFADAGLNIDYVPENFHGEPDMILYHCKWTALGFWDYENRVILCFFDGSLPLENDGSDDAPDCKNLAEWYAYFAQQTAEWGCLDTFAPTNTGNEPHRIAFADISKIDMNAETAAEILRALTAADGEENAL